MGESFRNTDLGKRLSANGLSVVGAQARNALELRLEQGKQGAKLREQMLAPIGRLLQEDASQRAMQELRAQTLERMTVAPASLSTSYRTTGDAVHHPLTLYPSAGSTIWSWPPFDDVWTDKSGNCMVLANKNSGVVNTSLGMSGDMSPQRPTSSPFQSAHPWRGQSSEAPTWAREKSFTAIKISA